MFRLDQYKTLSRISAEFPFRDLDAANKAAQRAQEELICLIIKQHVGRNPNDEDRARIKVELLKGYEVPFVFYDSECLGTISWDEVNMGYGMFSGRVMFTPKQNYIQVGPDDWFNAL